MLTAIPISRAPGTDNRELDHNVGAGTFTPAPTVVTDGFLVRSDAGSMYDAYEFTYRFDATATVATSANVRPWFWMPNPNPGGAGGHWMAGKIMEGLTTPGASSDVHAPVRRINSVPVGATRMYLQVVAINGPAANLYMVAYGIVGIVANVDVGDIEVDVEGSSIVMEGMDSIGTYRSPEDFVATYTAATQLTLTDMPFTPVIEQFVMVICYDTDTNVSAMYTIADPALAWTWTPGAVAGEGVLQITGAAFVATDDFVVIVRGPVKPYLEVMADFSGPGVHQSPVHFAAAFATAQTLNITGMAFDPVLAQIRAVVVQDAGGLVKATYVPRHFDFGWAAGAPGAGVLTVTGANFPATGAFIVFIEGPEINTKLANENAAAADRVKRTQHIDPFGNAWIDHNVHGTAYQSPDDFSAVWASATTLTITLLPFPAAFENFVSVAEYDGDNLIALYRIEDATYDWSWAPTGGDASGGVLTVATATFANTSTYVVTLRGPEKSYLTLNTIGDLTLHRSPRDFDVAWTNATTLAVTNMEFDPNEADILGVVEWTVGNQTTIAYTPRDFPFAWTPGAPGAGTLVVTGASFVNGSTFIVVIAGTEHNTSAANTARTVNTVVKQTQHIGPSGDAQPAGADSATAIFMRLLGAMGIINGDGVYKSPIHFTAAYQAATAVDLAGGFPAITDISQFLMVVQISSAGAMTIYYPHTHVFAWDAVNDRLTVTGATFANTDVFGVVIYGPNRYANDAGNYELKAEVFPYPLRSDDAGIQLITAAQAFTNAWADLGPEISMFGYSGVTFYLELDINDDSDLRFRVLAKHESGGAGEYPLAIKSPGAGVVALEDLYYEFTDDIDQLMAIRVETNGEIPYIQAQILRGVDGAGVDAQVDSAFVVRGTFGGAS